MTMHIGRSLSGLLAFALVLKAEVILLGEANSTNYVGSYLKHDTIVMFMAPWCSHSKKFIPIFEEAEREWGAHTDLVFAIVNCIEAKELYYRYDIQMYPTIKYFFGNGKDMEAISYKKELEIEPFADFLKRMTSSALLTNGLLASDFHKFKRDVLTLFTPIALLIRNENEHPQLADHFEYACKVLEHIRCSSSSDQELATKLGAASASSSYLLVYREFHGEKDAIMISPHMFLNQPNLTRDWVESHSYPLVTQFTQSNDALIFSDARPGYKKHVVIVAASSDPATVDLLQGVRQVAAQQKGFCVFIHLDPDDKSSYVQSILKDLQVSVDSIPSAIIVHSQTTKVDFHVLPAASKLSQDSLSSFVDDFKTFKLKATRSILADSPELASSEEL